MKMSIANFVVSLSIFVLVMSALGLIFYIQMTNISDEEIVAQLEANVVPYVLEKEVFQFNDSDWCRILAYGNRTVSSQIPDGSPNCLPEALDFENEDELIFADLKSKLTNFYAISYERPISYRSEHAGLEGQTFGLGFYISCAFCRTRYVYFPEYESLPPDIDMEIWYTPINSNSYRVDQDWN